MSIADLETLYTAYEAALGAADYDTAIAKLMTIRARLASTPNLTRSLAGGGSQGITWNPGELDSLIAQCRQLKAEAIHSSVGGVQRSNIIYARATAV